MSTPGAAAEPGAPERLPDDVVAALALDGDAAVRVPHGRVNAVFRAHREGRPVALRRSAWFRTLEEVQYEADVLAALSTVGASTAAVVGGPVALPSGVWLASEWLDGEHPVAPVDPEVFGRLLAQLHAETRSLTALGQRPGWARLDQFFTAPRGDGSAALIDVIADFEAAWGAVGARLRLFAERTHGRLAEAGPTELIVVHGDFGPHQTLWSGGQLTGVVDWDFCHLDTALGDLAVATSLARPTADRAGAMLRGYAEAASFDVGGLERLADHRRAFHLANLANQVCVLWRHGVDVSRQIAVITERLEREQWWEAMLRAGARRAGPPSRQEVVGPDSSDLEVALELADRAALVALHHVEAGVVADLKDDRSPVTDGDRAVELMLRESLAALRPDDAILGEEFGRSGDSSRTWILDPIDGTTSYVAGGPHWRIQIALQDGDEIVVAVVDEPALSRRFWAMRGGGAFERTAGEGDDGDSDTVRRLAVAGDERTDVPLVAFHPRSVASRLPEHVPMEPRSPLPLVELVQGTIDAFYVECCQIWDHAPWVLLVEEAGGRFTDHDGGRRPDRRGGLYSSARWHDRLLAATAS